MEIALQVLEALSRLPSTAIIGGVCIGSMWFSYVVIKLCLGRREDG